MLLWLQTSYFFACRLCVDSDHLAELQRCLLNECVCDAQARALFESEVESASSLELKPQHMFGFQLDTLSAAQIDALEEWHYLQLEKIASVKVATYRAQRDVQIVERCNLADELRGLL